MLNNRTVDLSGNIFYVRTNADPDVNGGFPLGLPLSELEQTVQEAFATRDMCVIPEYFEPGSEYFPELAFVVYVRDNGNKFTLAGGVIATNEQVGDFEFTYYDKIFVSPEYQRNGIMTKLLGLARQVSGGKGVKPSVLKTSDGHLDKKYGKLSDINLHYEGYYVHGFGFFRF